MKNISIARKIEKHYDIRDVHEEWPHVNVKGEIDCQDDVYAKAVELLNTIDDHCGIDLVDDISEIDGAGQRAIKSAYVLYLTDERKYHNDMLCAIMNAFSDGSWICRQITGSVQSEWAYVFYDGNVYSWLEIEGGFASDYFNKTDNYSVEFWTVGDEYSLDNDGNPVDDGTAELIDTAAVYVYDFQDAEEEIAGIEECDDIIILEPVVKTVWKRAN